MADEKTDALDEFIAEMGREAKAIKDAQAQADVARRMQAEQDAVEPTFTPSCPICSKAMVKRTARKGPNAGQTFWGCSGYPSCRGTRPAT